MSEQKTLYIIQVWWPNAGKWRDEVAAFSAEEFAEAQEGFTAVRRLWPHRQFRLVRRVTTVTDTVIDPAPEEVTE